MRRLVLSCLGLFMACTVHAMDYRSVNVPAAILYDAPSQKAKKLFLIKAQSPVEVVVRLDGWLKVRDVEGTLAWIEEGQLAEKRMLIVTAPTAELRQAAQPDGAVVTRCEKWVVLEYLGPAGSGWASVRHRDGQSGFVRSTQVWGL